MKHGYSASDPTGNAAISDPYQQMARLAIAIIALALFVTGAVPTEAQQRVAPQEKLVAAFLYKLPMFVDWPAGAFPSPDSPIIITILGDDPFGSALADAVGGKKMDAHPFSVRRVKWAQDVEDTTHIIFLNMPTATEEETALEKLRKKAKNALIASWKPGMAERGSTINFVATPDGVRLEINREAAESSGLVISSKLLSLARIVKPEGRRE